MTEKKISFSVYISQHAIETPLRKMFWIIKAHRKFPLFKIKIAEEA